jgi:hypothetical protein
MGAENSTFNQIDVFEKRIERLLNELSDQRKVSLETKSLLEASNKMVKTLKTQNDKLESQLIDIKIRFSAISKRMEDLEKEGEKASKKDCDKKDCDKKDCDKKDCDKKDYDKKYCDKKYCDKKEKNDCSENNKEDDYNDDESNDNEEFEEVNHHSSCESDSDSENSNPMKKSYCYDHDID